MSETLVRARAAMAKAGRHTLSNYLVPMLKKHIATLAALENQGKGHLRAFLHYCGATWSTMAQDRWRIEDRPKDTSTILVGVYNKLIGIPRLAKNVVLFTTQQLDAVARKTNVAVGEVVRLAEIIAEALGGGHMNVAPCGVCNVGDVQRLGVEANMLATDAKWAAKMNGNGVKAHVKAHVAAMMAANKKC